MAKAEDVRALEALTPWQREDFRADLLTLTASTEDAARRFAADMRVLARLTGQVPRCPFDERGASPWTSFRREVAVARRISDDAAAAEIRTAQMLSTVLPRTRELLEAGAITVPRAQAFVRELDHYEDDLAGLLDAELAERVAGLPVWRIRQEVRHGAARLDADAAALRAAVANANRSVSFHADQDDQATVMVSGPAVPLTRWYATLDERARALRAAGDPRTLAQLRFDLATSTFPCEAHTPADLTAPADAAATDAAAADAAAADAAAAEAPPAEAALAPAVPDAAAGLRPGFVEPAPTNCRMSRPVQASIGVPVETSLGLSNEPAWLDGYGWISAPTARHLLVDAELRKVCTRTGTGELVSLDPRDVRPPPTPSGVRSALLDMVFDEATVYATSWRTEDQHDPSPPLRELVALRDRFCDGPTGTRTPARRAELDHERPYPEGPTAAWNLGARATRTHQLKHYGWTPLRTPTSTLWTSPAGQVVEVPRQQKQPPGIDHDPDQAVSLPDPDDLAALDAAQLRPPSDDDVPPWLSTSEQDTTEWTWLDHEEAPF